MGKRGAALKFIFLVLMLIIVGSVVLSLLIKYSEKYSSPEKTFAFNSFTLKQKMIQCETKCSLITRLDESSYLDYCASFFEFDADEDGKVNEVFEYGRRAFCQDKIPCFAIFECNHLDADCKEVLCRQRPDIYYSNFYYEDSGAYCSLSENEKSWIAAFNTNTDCA